MQSFSGSVVKSVNEVSCAGSIATGELMPGLSPVRVGVDCGEEIMLEVLGVRLRSSSEVGGGARPSEAMAAKQSRSWCRISVNAVED